MFIVKYDNEERNATWSYIDILTKTMAPKTGIKKLLGFYKRNS